MSEPTANHFMQAKSAVSALLFAYEDRNDQFRAVDDLQNEVQLAVKHSPYWESARLSGYIDEIVGMSNVYYNKRDAYFEGYKNLSTAVRLETFNVMIRTISETVKPKNVGTSVSMGLSGPDSLLTLVESWTYTGTNLTIYSTPQHPDKDPNPFPYQDEYCRYIAEVRKDLNTTITSRLEDIKTVVLMDKEERLSWSAFVDVFVDACETVADILTTTAICVEKYAGMASARSDKLRELKSKRLVRVEELPSFPDTVLLPHQVVLKRRVLAARSA